VGVTPLQSQIGAPVGRMLGFRSGSCLHTKHNTRTISEAAVSAHKTQYRNVSEMAMSALKARCRNVSESAVSAHKAQYHKC
jgi:hypothetical protein